MIDTPIITEAVYHANKNPAYAGNPLIEALPPILSDSEWVQRLNVLPVVSDEVRSLRPEERLVALVDLERFNFPLPEGIDLARRIESALYRGYSTKNPCLATSNHFLHYLSPDETPVQPLSGRFEPRPVGMTLVGPSGSGKTRLYESILSKFPQVIEHKVYNGKPLPIKQVVWLKVDCPEDQSLVTFAGHFLSALDDALNEKFFDEAIKSRINKGLMLERVIRKARLFRVGLIVLEEFSNLRLPKKATFENIPPLLKLILNLMNGSGVPVLYTGNEEMFETLQFTLKTARRSENGGVIEMGPMHKATWAAISKRLWKLQITNTNTSWSEESANKLYEASRGLVEIAVRGFFEAQRLVIGTDDERLTPTIIEQGAINAIRLSNKTLDWSVSQNYKDGMWSPKVEEASENKIKLKTKAYIDENINKNKVESIGLNDPSRPQHPEFVDSINNLRDKSPLIPNYVRHSLLRDICVEDDMINELSNQNIFLEDMYVFNIVTKVGNGGV